jgi:uncharacterized protein
VSIRDELRLNSTHIEALCRRYHVKRLDLFGSDEFDPATSDLDFLVEFEDMAPAAYAQAYFGLLQGLEQLFSRAVDLVTAPSLSNPYFKQRIDETKAALYAA